MAHEYWLANLFAAMMAVVVVYCVGRLAFAGYLTRNNRHDVTVAHVLMGTAMVGMLVPRWNVVPICSWEVVFAGVALYFLARAVRCLLRGGLRPSDRAHLSHDLVHFAMASAMLYMYWLASASPGSPGGMGMGGPPQGAGDPSLTFAFVVVLFASAIWQLDALGQFAHAPTHGTQTPGGTPRSLRLAGSPVTVVAPRPYLAPRLEVACHIAMCVTMGYMLILMV